MKGSLLACNVVDPMEHTIDLSARLYTYRAENDTYVLVYVHLKT